MAKQSKKPIQKDPKKESEIKELSATLETQGFTVRREKLKQGSGFKVISGVCRLEDKKLIFLDPRLTQDDQILFLKGKLAVAA